MNSLRWYRSTNSNGPWEDRGGREWDGKTFSEPYNNLTVATQWYFKVTVWDKSGNSVEKTLTAWTKANAPTVTILNNNTWTKTKGVQIQGIANHKVMYTTDGSDPRTSGTKKQLGSGGETWVMGFDINANCTVKAVYVNTVTGQVNSEVGQATTTKIDTTVPTIAELELVSSSSSQIAVKAKGADTESGVYMYTFQKSTTSATTGFTTDTSYQVNTGTREHTYSTDPNTTYYLKVIVADACGNTKESNVLTVKTKAEAPTITVTDENEWKQEKTVTVTFPYEQTDTDKYYIRCKFKEYDLYIVGNLAKFDDPTETRYVEATTSDGSSAVKSSVLVSDLFVYDRDFILSPGGGGSMRIWSNTWVGVQCTFKLRQDCEVSATMGTNITTINPSDNQLTTEMAKKAISKIDNTPPSMSVIYEDGDSANYIRLNL